MAKAEHWEHVTTIDGADFGRAVFSLYIGRNPPNRGLRTGLLGGR